VWPSNCSIPGGIHLQATNDSNPSASCIQPPLLRCSATVLFPRYGHINTFSGAHLNSCTIRNRRRRYDIQQNKKPNGSQPVHWVVTHTCDCVIQDLSAKEMLYSVPNTTVFLCKRGTLQFTLFTTKVINNMWPNNSKARSRLPHISVSSMFNLYFGIKLTTSSSFIF